MRKPAARVLTYQARDDGDLLVAQVHPLGRQAAVAIFRDHLLKRKVFVHSPGRPAIRYARLLEGLGYHPSVARTLVAIDGEEFVDIAARTEDRAERHATFEFFDASLRAKKKDADPSVDLPPALGTEIEFAIFRDAYARFRTRRPEHRAALLDGLLDRFLRANLAPRTGPLPPGMASRIDRLSESVGLSLAPESITVTDDAVTLALWRGRVRITGVEAPPFVGQVNERADLRFDRKAEHWQLSENWRPAPCPLGPFGYSRDYLLQGLWFDDAARRSESFERLALAGTPEEDLEPYVRALAAERDPDVRAAGVAHLRDFGDEAARETLVAALDDEVEAVREAAARALAEAEALAADPRVRPKVERLLIKAADEAEARALFALYARALPGGRVAFLKELAPLKPPRLLAPLIETIGACGAAPGEDREAAAAFLKEHAKSKREDVQEAVRAARGAMRRRRAGASEESG